MAVVRAFISAVAQA